MMDTPSAFSTSVVLERKSSQCALFSFQVLHLKTTLVENALGFKAFKVLILWTTQLWRLSRKCFENTFGASRSFIKDA